METPTTSATRPLRILYHHRIAASDGMRVHIEEMIHALRARGHVVKIVGPGNALEEGTPASNRLEATADLLRRYLPAAILELLELLYNLPAWIRLSREARQFRPDILYERYNLFLLAGLHLKRWLRIPMVLEVNAPLASERAAFGNLSLHGLARWSENTVWRHSDVVLPVTGVLAEEVRRSRGTAAGIHVMPNGARLDLAPSQDAVLALRDRYGFSENTVVLGFVGFVRAWHGVGWALEALPALPAHVHLLIVGDGPARPELEARAAEMGVTDRVHFSGRIPHNDIPAHVRMFDVALQTASVAYASPLKLLEYMTLGCAIIAPDQPNICEILRHDTNALLFDPLVRQSFTAALSRLCGDEELRRRLGRAARRTVEETPLTWAHNAARFEYFARCLLAPANASVHPSAAIPPSTVVPSP
jgi:glycosyltransferase involved in cell wall biosynthesis